MSYWDSCLSRGPRSRFPCLCAEAHPRAGLENRASSLAALFVLEFYQEGAGWKALRACRGDQAHAPDLSPSQ